jgi:hypothetical protein
VLLCLLSDSVFFPKYPAFNRIRARSIAVGRNILPLPGFRSIPVLSIIIIIIPCATSAALATRSPDRHLPHLSSISRGNGPHFPLRASSRRRQAATLRNCTRLLTRRSPTCRRHDRAPQKKKKIYIVICSALYATCYIRFSICALDRIHGRRRSTHFAHRSYSTYADPIPARNAQVQLYPK